ncbi:UDP-3-O-(3-hydroxymyristoyl)glucosamine N-acyltransferase [Limnoglobus roseus]|uniref:UDP-3-O-acylglucosamine N-acyltransferase n=1 Tax=Limnoglobus roseus TaxID=2598579 RepID=A0A5C1AKU5_9BACT|nr:UDP-3-O-(3-hydroxymyristoyl)glucosamine N-acyltransferase [Limnoglobus roseus]QEL19999.1 UDP-3-O-(3-hydroxymyristoyl)glucosamine N-acyltransferase [Limnoglobus roseus]
MSLTVRQMAALVAGEVVGNGDAEIVDARPLTDAKPGHITFVEDDRYLDAWHHSPASAALVLPHVPVNGRPLIKVLDPLMAFVSIVKHLRGNSPAATSSIHPSAQIHPTAVIGTDAEIGPFVVVEAGCVIGARATLLAGATIGKNCRLGDDVTLHPHAVLYDTTVIGNRVTIHANCVLGADGFGYRTQGGRHVKVPQLGYVEIADDVEIGACTTIDRGTFGPTRVGQGTKIDNLVMIAHNCQIGRHNLLVSQVGIAGSTTTGDYVVMAGQVGIADHLHVGDRAILGAKAGVHKDVPPDSRMLGAPATPDREQMRIMMSLEKLPELRRDLRKIKQMLGLPTKAEGKGETKE